MRGSSVPMFALFILLFSTFQLSVYDNTAFAQAGKDSEVYEVKSGDTLFDIAQKYNDLVSWSKIYKANGKKILKPDLIYPGQKLLIPSTDTGKKLSRVKKNESDQTPSDNSQEIQDKKQKLKRFRKAFSKLVSESKENKAGSSKKTTMSSEEMVLGLGGMILDKTRTRMGRNFYSIFYKHWEAPKSTKNYTVTISERPVPSRGTIVRIKIDGELVFGNRLSSKYHEIEKTAKRAVYICNKRLKKKIALKDEFEGY